MKQIKHFFGSIRASLHLICKYNKKIEFLKLWGNGGENYLNKKPETTINMSFRVLNLRSVADSNCVFLFAIPYP
jgi:hypothetical protein